MHTPTLLFVSLLLIVAAPLRAAAPSTSQNDPTQASVGGRDPEGFPRPADFTRTSYERTSDGKHDKEIATYHAGGDFAAVLKQCREQLGGAGWKSQHQSDSGSGLHEVAIDDWLFADGEAELRFYPLRGGGTDIRVRVTLYQAASSATTSAPSTPAAASIAKSGDAPAPASAAPIVVVPDVVGQTLLHAGQDLDSVGLKMGIAPAKSSEGRPAQSDAIAEQNPPAGARVARGSPVTVSTWFVTVRVPEVLQMQFDDAKQRITGAGGPGGGHRLEVKEGTGVPSSTPSHIGRVASQTPTAGTLVPENSTVTLNLYVATGPMPNVVGKTYSDALAILEGLARGPGARRFQVTEGPPRPAIEDRMIGKVAEQSPAAGEPASNGCTVTLSRWVATTPMPNLVGRTFQDAKHTLEQLAHAPGGRSCRLQIQEGLGKPASTPSLVGKVAEQRPAAGDPVSDGSSVRLTLWVATLPLPNLVGKTFAEAQAAAGGSNPGRPTAPKFQVQRGALLPTTDGRLAGTVSAQDPAAGMTVGEGGTVTLTMWVLTGPMPNFVGRPYSAAESELSQLAHAPVGRALHYQLQQGTPKPTQDYRQDGIVAEQTPAARTLTPDGSTVTLTLYRLGPP